MTQDATSQGAQGFAAVTQHTQAISEHKATQRGALDGYRITCTCGATWTTLFHSSAIIEAATHNMFHKGASAIVGVTR